MLKPEGVPSGFLLSTGWISNGFHNFGVYFHQQLKKGEGL